MSKNPPKVSAKLTGYQNLMSQSDWSNLHPTIQNCFSNKLYKAVTYQGVMKNVYLSFAGKLLAQCCRTIGNPLALHSEKNVPVAVKVYPNRQLGGMTWDRFYHYKKSSVNRVKSTKCLDSNGKLVEMVGFGFGMQLDVFEQNHAIVFQSNRFFWKFKQIDITIPDWLSPGKTIVSQRATSEEEFEFKLNVKHTILGTVFRQIGVFKLYKNYTALNK